MCLQKEITYACRHTNLIGKPCHLFLTTYPPFIPGNSNSSRIPDNPKAMRRCPVLLHIGEEYNKNVRCQREECRGKGWDAMMYEAGNKEMEMLIGIGWFVTENEWAFERRMAHEHRDEALQLRQEADAAAAEAAKIKTEEVEKEESKEMKQCHLAEVDTKTVDLAEPGDDREGERGVKVEVKEVEEEL